MAEDFRLSKIDDAIQRLASVASDLSRMIAVHEQRLAQQEKVTDGAIDLLEQRRIEFDQKLDDVYNVFRAEDAKIIDELKKNRESSRMQHEEQNQKINKLQQFMWMALGAGTALGYVLSIVTNYYKITNH